MSNLLLQLRKESKENKPEFIRQDTNKKKRLGIKWRKPKGLHSKIRQHLKGRRKSPSPGYKSPKKIKGQHSSGLVMVRVFSVKDLSELNKESEGAIIPKTVGMRKRYEILKKAKELNIKILNINIDEYIKKIEDFISSKKKESTKKKTESKSQKETKTDKLKDSKEISSEKEKKEAEKKEKDKVLTKKA